MKTLKQTATTLLLFSAFLASSSCIGPALAARGKVAAHDREAFAKANTDREAAGLRPLTRNEYMNMDDRTTTTRVVTTTEQTDSSAAETQTSVRKR